MPAKALAEKGRRVPLGRGRNHGPQSAHSICQCAHRGPRISLADAPALGDARTNGAPASSMLPFPARIPGTCTLILHAPVDWDCWRAVGVQPIMKEHAPSPCSE